MAKFRSQFQFTKVVPYGCAMTRERPRRWLRDFKAPPRVAINEARIFCACARFPNEPINDSCGKLVGKRRTRKKFLPLIKKTHDRRPAVHTKSNCERLILILNGQWRRSLISFYGSVLKMCARCAIYPRNLFQSRRSSVVIRTELTNNGMCSKSNEFPSSLAPVLQKLRQLALNTPIWP